MKVKCNCNHDICLGCFHQQEHEYDEEYCGPVCPESGKKCTEISKSLLYKKLKKVYK